MDLTGAIAGADSEANQRARRAAEAEQGHEGESGGE